MMALPGKCLSASRPVQAARLFSKEPATRFVIHRTGPDTRPQYGFALCLLQGSFAMGLDTLFGFQVD